MLLNVAINARDAIGDAEPMVRIRLSPARSLLRT
jgi:hypothetical protein